MKKPIFALLLATTVLGGCANSIGRPQVVSDGTISQRVEDEAAKQTRGRLKLFVETAILAYPKTPTSTLSPATQELFLRRGFDVIERQCVSYLDGKADRQRTINVVRDTFGPVSALTSGVIGLTDAGDTIDNDVLSALGLVTTATTAGFEVYERRFLFDAKNLNSVKRLVIRALNEDSKARMASIQPADQNWSTSIRFLRKNQEICNPHEILELVQSAIANGKIEAIQRPDPTTEPVEQLKGLEINLPEKSEANVRYEGVRVAPIE